MRKEGDARQQAITTLRTLVDRIVLYPGDNCGKMEIEIEGELAAILRFTNGDPIPLEKGMLKLVAGARYGQKHTHSTAYYKIAV